MVYNRVKLKFVVWHRKIWNTRKSKNLHCFFSGVFFAKKKSVNWIQRSFFWRHWREFYYTHANKTSINKFSRKFIAVNRLNKSNNVCFPCTMQISSKKKLWNISIMKDVDQFEWYDGLITTFDKLRTWRIRKWSYKTW